MKTANDRGKLKIGDDWNAIRIIALSQSNPLKAIAEFVENSIDARASTITITREDLYGGRIVPPATFKKEGRGPHNSGGK